MASYFSRQRYDQCYNTEFINQQVNPGKYNVNPEVAENNSICHSLNGPRANRNNVTGELGKNDLVYRTDIESMLYNLDVPVSRCMDKQTLVEKNERLKKISKENKSEDCKNNAFSYTRLNEPALFVRDAEYKRYGHPIIDPINWVFNGINGTEQAGNERFGVNTKLKAKDSVMPPNFNVESELIGNKK